MVGLATHNSESDGRNEKVFQPLGLERRLKGVHSFVVENAPHAKPSVGLLCDPVCGCTVVLEGSDALQHAVGPLYLDHPFIAVT